MTEIAVIPLSGLRIDMRRFDAVKSLSEAKAAAPAASAGGRGTTRVVSPEVLAETRVDECRCEDDEFMESLGKPVLHAGMPVKGPDGLQGVSPQWNDADKRWQAVPGGEGIGTGCTTGWVCNRLDKVRRRYGV